MDSQTAKHPNQRPTQPKGSQKCPKCGARNGVYETRMAVSEGHIAGISCVLCGYWRQRETPHKRYRELVENEPRPTLKPENPRLAARVGARLAE